jgi:hypothetical protein
MPFPFTQEQDRRIQQLYTPPYVRGLVAQQARKWQCKINDIVNRREQLGLSALLTAEPRNPWTKVEIEILKQHPHLSHKAMRLLLRRNGYERTPTAIRSYRSRLGWRSRLELDEITVGYSAHGLAQILGVENCTVIRWIKSGELKATAEPGEQRCVCYRIKPSAVRRFLMDYLHRWEPRKVDKYWLVDILTGDTK